MVAATDMLSGLLDDIERLCLENDHIPVGILVDTLGARGFGPVLILLSALLILPVGMIPGMPGLVAVMMMLIGVQMFGRSNHLWVPEALRKKHLPIRILRTSLHHMRPVAKRLRALLGPRLTIIFDTAAIRVGIATILITTGAVIFFIGFIPGLPFFLSVHVLLIGLGQTARDGWVTLLGMAIYAPVVWLIAGVLL